MIIAAATVAPIRLLTRSQAVFSYPPTLVLGTSLVAANSMTSLSAPRPVPMRISATPTPRVTRGVRG